MFTPSLIMARLRRISRRDTEEAECAEGKTRSRVFGSLCVLCASARNLGSWRCRSRKVGQEGSVTAGFSAQELEQQESQDELNGLVDRADNKPGQDRRERNPEPRCREEEQ